MKSIDPFSGTARMIATVDDTLERDGQMLVLASHQVVLLSEAGAVVINAAREPVTLDEVSALLVEEFGPPPDGDVRDATRVIVDPLLERGLLAIVPAS